MKQILWKNTYSVGNHALDEQHRKLFDIINDIYDAMSSGQSKSDLEKLFERLEKYTLTHFSSEEKFLEKQNYSKLAQQKDEHSFFIEKIAKLKIDHQRGDVLILVKTMDFLKDWLIQHILGTDMVYSEYLHARDAAAGN